MNVKIKKLFDDAILPQKNNPNDAGFDCVARSMRTTKIKSVGLSYGIQLSEPEDYIEYGFGFSLEIPEGWCGLLFPRSSISKYDLMLCNSVGVIDSGYRGEILARFKKTKEVGNFYEVGDKVCQIVFYKLPEITFELTDTLDDLNDRGGGFGSSGK